MFIDVSPISPDPMSNREETANWTPQGTPGSRPGSISTLGDRRPWAFRSALFIEP
jgi:hypothetical protein